MLPACAPTVTPQADLSRGAPVKPILCRGADGGLAPMHELDVVLM